MDVMHIDFFSTPHPAGTKTEQVGVEGREGASGVCLRKMTFCVGSKFPFHAKFSALDVSSGKSGSSHSP